MASGPFWPVHESEHVHFPPFVLVFSYTHMTTTPLVVAGACSHMPLPSCQLQAWTHSLTLPSDGSSTQMNRSPPWPLHAPALTYTHRYPVLCKNIHSHIHCLLWPLQSPELTYTLYTLHSHVHHNTILCRPCAHMATVLLCSLQVNVATHPLPLSDLSRQVHASDHPPTADVCGQLLSQSHCLICLVQVHVLTCTWPVPLSTWMTIPPSYI